MTPFFRIAIPVRISRAHRLSKLVLSIAAVAFLALRRVRQDDLDLLALVAFLVVVTGSVILILVLRSPDLAMRVGDLLGRAVARVARIFRRDVKTDFRALVREFRVQASDVLRKRTPIGLAAGITARITGFMILLLAVRFVDIGADEVHWTVVFAAFSVAMALGVIPICNMPRITEFILIGVLTAAAGKGFSDQIAAAVFVYRILTWLSPIPSGGFAFNRWRSQMRSSGKEDLLDAFDSPGSDSLRRKRSETNREGLERKAWIWPSLRSGSRGRSSKVARTCARSSSASGTDQPPVCLR